MPPFEAFRDAESDYPTLAHRLTHWTEHPQRLCCDWERESWGDAGYAAEELAVELGSAFICADLNLAPETPDATYVGSRRRDFRSEHISPHKRAGSDYWIPGEKPTYRELAPKSRRGNDSINSQSTECGDPGSDECR
jgi:antirestriction protein ArdC